MQGRRDSASTIWRTVVFAGAMLGCGSPAHKDTTPTPPPQPQNVTPTPTPTPAVTPQTNNNTQNANATPDTPPKPGFKPNGDPCDGVIVPPQQPQPNPDPVDEDAQATKGKKRPRGGGDRPVGRGFVLA